MSDRPVHLIIGAAGAAGSATVRRLTDAGAHVVLAGRTAADLDELRAATGAAAAHEVDARDISQVEDLITGVRDATGRLDGVANLVGSVLLKPAHLTTAEEWAETIAVNLTSAFAVVRSAAPLMGRGEGGSIVLASSAAAQTGIANHEAIAAAVTWLLDPATSWVTGQIVGVDGGLGRVRTRTKG